MSSSDNDDDGAHYIKKRKAQRACDTCRRRKSDGVQESDIFCSNCIKLSFPRCTYEDIPSKRHRPSGKEYTKLLEAQVARLTSLFRKLHPELDLDVLLRDERASPQVTASITTSPRPSPTPSSGELISQLLRASTEVPEQHDDEDSRDIYVSDDFKRLTVHDPEENLFFGKSSGVALLQTAMNMKQALSGRPRAEHVKNPQVWSQRRECFWTTPSWESSPPLGPPTLSLQFPEEDLMPVLIDNYFENFNLLLPLLHRPTFERSMKDGLHLIHDTFGAIVLLVCALGSRQSDDPRVCLSDVEHPEYSRGWKYFNQVQIVRQSVLSAPTLYDLQLYCLAIEFLRDSSVGHSCWTLVGIALRLAQEVGVHKWRRKNRAPTVENELWMRAFWILLSLDRTLSSLLGRSCTIGSEELDLDLPLEVDDEYWEHPDPEKAFRQPDDKPSLITSFNCSLRLMHILGTALRTLV
ncbi:hypothetical protein ONZ45_g16282 [Pleurotus djamor]|nr:hypothetical protein ONZ45_g16282 [Pleurotus djamor]